MTWRGFLVAGLLCWGIGAAAYGALRLIFGPMPVYATVTWAPTVDDTVRQWLERRYSLSQPEPRADARSWEYVLTDSSSANLRALVEDPSVEDTQDINRTTFRVNYLAPRPPYPTTYPWIPERLRGVVILCFICGCVAIGFGLFERAVPGAVGAWLVSSAPRDAIFLLILLAALSLRVYFAATAEYIHDENNASIPLSQSISLAPGHLQLPIRGRNHPTLPAYFVKVSSTLFGTTPLGYRLVHLLAGLVVVVMVFLLARQWFGPVAARWAAALLAFNEYYLGVSSRATAHVPYLLFTACAICAFGRFTTTERPGYLYAAGASLGLAFYAKEHAALLLAVFLVMLLHSQYRRWWRGPHVYLAPVVFLFLIAPDVFWNLTARGGSAQATYADHLQRIGGIGFSPYPLMFYGRDAVQWLYRLVTDRRLFDPTSEYLSVNPAIGLLLLGAVLVTTVRKVKPVGSRFLLVVFWGVFGFFTLIRPGGSPKDLDPASWIWVDVTLFPAVLLAGALLAGATGRARYAAWALAGGALLYAGAGIVG